MLMMNFILILVLMPGRKFFCEELTKRLALLNH